MASLKNVLNGALTELGLKKQEPELSPEREIIDKVRAYIRSEGFFCGEGVIETLFLSLKAKPFVMISGRPGSGKTTLARIFCKAVGADEGSGRFKMLPVRSDWCDPSDLFGHLDLNGSFVPGAITDFIKQAESDIQNPYFLLLDEINLSRVEHYLSDILSLMETRERDHDGHIITQPVFAENFFFSDAAAKEKYAWLILPENLYIIGTVNSDETTCIFSPKVLDRVNVIELPPPELIPSFSEDDKAPETLELPNSFFKSEYLTMSQCSEDEDTVKAICGQLEKLNAALKNGGYPISLRVRDELVFYCLYNKKFGLLPEDEALDYQVLQRILPQIEGGSSRARTTLCELFRIWVNEYRIYEVECEEISVKMFKALESQKAQHLRTGGKIAQMVRRLEEDGYTSYWF